MNIGAKLKDFRKKQGLTLQQLSEMTELSVGFLSNLERDVTSPSISNLQQICQALEIHITDLIEPVQDKKIVVKKEERREIFTTANLNVKYEMITGDNNKYNGICITTEPNAEYNNVNWGHLEDELGIIVKGSIEIDLEDRKYILNEGDTIFIKKNTPHRYRNIGDEECISYWISIKS